MFINVNLYKSLMYFTFVILQKVQFNSLLFTFVNHINI